MDKPSSLLREVSPPPGAKRRKASRPHSENTRTNSISKLEPALAAVEAGRAKIEDHLAYFSAHLAKASRVTPAGVPRLSIEGFADLYQRNHTEHGNHFVVHQHNHPKAGLHCMKLQVLPLSNDLINYFR